MQLQCGESESTFDYFRATHAYIDRHGKPIAFHRDKHGVFRVNKAGATTGDGMTQFGRALDEINIDIICANSPQAKRRVERANQTLQDRLVKQLRRAGVSTPPEGNVFLALLMALFLPLFLAEHNARFAKEPFNNKNLHRSLEEADDLDATFACKEERVVSRDPTLQYDTVVVLLEPNEITRSLAPKRVTIMDYPDGKLAIRHAGVDLP